MKSVKSDPERIANAEVSDGTISGEEEEEEEEGGEGEGEEEEEEEEECISD